MRSFAHCFASEHVTFNNRVEADHWALSAAQAIIDKALPEFKSAVLPDADAARESVAPAFNMARLPRRVIDRFRYLLRLS